MGSSEESSEPEDEPPELESEGAEMLPTNPDAVAAPALTKTVKLSGRLLQGILKPQEDGERVIVEKGGMVTGELQVAWAITTPL